jgi:hypothetical protein
MWLYFADGWIQVSLTTGWSLVLFQAVGGRYDSFGGTLSLAALAGALGGMALGRIIDMGHSRHAVWLNAGVLVVGPCCGRVGDSATAAVAVAVGTTLVAGPFAHVDDAGLQCSQACALRIAVSGCGRGG